VNVFDPDNPSLEPPFNASAGVRNHRPRRVRAHPDRPRPRPGQALTSTPAPPGSTSCPKPRCGPSSRAPTATCGSDYEGLARFDGATFEIFDRSRTADLLGTAVYHLREDSGGVLWAGTNGGLVRISLTGFHTFTTEDGLPSDLVYVTLRSQDGRLWWAPTTAWPCSTAPASWSPPRGPRSTRPVT